MVFYCWGIFKIRFGSISDNNISINQICWVSSFLLVSVITLFWCWHYVSIDISFTKLTFYYIGSKQPLNYLFNLFPLNHSLILDIAINSHICFRSPISVHNFLDHKWPIQILSTENLEMGLKTFHISSWFLKIKENTFRICDFSIEVKNTGLHMAASVKIIFSNLHCTRCDLILNSHHWNVCLGLKTLCDPVLHTSQIVGT